MAEKYPDITDWKNLNKYADLFKTSESGSKGQLLDGDPTYVTNDEAMVKNLNLNYKVVFGGSETALIQASEKAEENKKPLLGVLLRAAVVLLRDAAGKRQPSAVHRGCDADPAKVACDYPPYRAEEGRLEEVRGLGHAGFDLVKNFTWTNDDQNRSRRTSPRTRCRRRTPPRSGSRTTPTRSGLDRLTPCPM